MIVISKEEIKTLLDALKQNGIFFTSKATIDFLLIALEEIPTIDPENLRPQWIPVTERMPDVAGMPVLVVAVNRFNQRHVVKAFTDYSGQSEFRTNEKEYDSIWESAWKVTHWMPLPELPQEVSQ